MRTSLQKSANPNSGMAAECTKEEALATQETMTAGKGPFAETGHAEVPETKELNKSSH